MKKFALLLMLATLLFNCGKDQEPEVDPEPELFEVAGNYIGTWDDNIYSNFPISAELSKRGNNSYSGPFYYSQLGAYTPCCMDSGDNGKISFEIKGDSVINFVYNQKLLFYKGGCPGTYKGDGTWNEEIGLLSINFEGDDCDGSHTGGVITFRHQR